MGGVVLSNGAVVGVGWCSPLPSAAMSIEPNDEARREAVLAWGAVSLRDLPWRRTRSVVGPGVGDDAPADTGRPGDRSVAQFLERFPSPERAPPHRPAMSSMSGLASATTGVRSTFIAPQPQWSSHTAAGCRNVSKISSPYPVWVPTPPERCGLRPRASGGGRRHQHRPGPGSLGRHPAHTEPGSTTRRFARTGRSTVAVEPVAHGVRRSGVHEAFTVVWRVSRARLVQVAGRGRRPGCGFRCGVDTASPVRGE